MSPTERPSTRRGRQPQRDAARRTRLLETGLEVFGTTGYASSAIESLCEDAGVGTSSFYSEFANKEALLRAVYDEVVGRVGSALAAALETEPAALRSFIEAAVRAFVGAATADHRLVRVQVVEVMGVSPAMEQHRREVMHTFATRLEDTSERLHARSLTAGPISRLTALALVGAANELLVEWVTHQPELATEDVVRALTDLHLRALAAPGR